MAVLDKILSRREQNKISTFIKQDGSSTEPGKETLETLIKAHFPKATMGTPTQSYAAHPQVLTADLADRYEWIDTYKVRRALLGFKPHKAPGPDNLPPIVFRYFPPNVHEQLVTIYKSCIALQYTPIRWRKTRVIFLPKPGKETYRSPKSFRPISLSNFLLKTLERLFVWDMDDQLKIHPIHDRQHGFTKGKSTEVAVSNTADRAEYYLYKKQKCLGIFLDISSAFDSISITHIRDMLFKHGGQQDQVMWYFDTLGERHLEINLQGESIQATANTGFPQGGVASAKFWLIAFNKACLLYTSDAADE